MLTGIVLPDKMEPLVIRLVGGFVVLLIGFSVNEFNETVTGIFGLTKPDTEFKLPVLGMMGLARESSEAECCTDPRLPVPVPERRGVVTGRETTAAVLSSEEILCRLSDVFVLAMDKELPASVVIKLLAYRFFGGRSGELVALTLVVVMVLARLLLEDASLDCFRDRSPCVSRR